MRIGLEKFSTNKTRVRVLFFGVLVLALLFLSLRDFYAYQFGFQPDAVEYTLLAHSLVQGPAFGLIHQPDAFEPTHYPFGFPLLLVPFFFAAPTDFTLPQWLSLGATLVSAGILYWGWGTLVYAYNDARRFGVVAMFLLAPTTILHTRVVLSEPIFTMLLLLTLWLAARLEHPPRSFSLWLAFSIASFFMVFVRSVGWIFMASILLYLGIALRRELQEFVRGVLIWSMSFVVLLGAVFALTPVTVENLIPAQYAEWFIAYGPVNPTGERVRDPQVPAIIETGGDSPTKTNKVVLDLEFILTHIRDDLRRMLLLSGGGDLEPELVNRLNLPSLLVLPGAIALGLVVFGNFVWARDTFHINKTILSLFQFSTLGYLVIAFFWRGGGERLFYPVQPQLYLTFLLGIGTLIAMGLRLFERFRTNPTPKISTQRANLILVLVVVGWLVLAVYRDLTLRTSYASWGDLRQRTAWVEANTPPDAILLSDWATLDFLVTGRPTIEYPQNIRSPSEILEFIERNQIHYVVVATDETWSIRGLAPGALRVTKSSASMRALVENGSLVRVYANSFPIQIFRVAP